VGPGRSSGKKPKEIYPEETLGKVLQIAMPRTPQIYAQGATGRMGPGGMETDAKSRLDSFKSIDQ